MNRIEILFHSLTLQTQMKLKASYKRAAVYLGPGWWLRTSGLVFCQQGCGAEQMASFPGRERVTRKHKEKGGPLLPRWTQRPPGGGPARPALSQGLGGRGCEGQVLLHFIDEEPVGRGNSARSPRSQLSDFRGQAWGVGRTPARWGWEGRGEGTPPSRPRGACGR